VKNPPILIAVLGFFGLMAGFYYLFAGLRIMGFDFFGVFANSNITESWGFWGIMWLILGVIYIVASWALWTLQPWAWLFAVLLSIFGLVSAFFVMLDSGLGPALGAAVIPALLLLYLTSKEVKAAFEVEATGR
jgi:hypothetical protein